MMSLSSAVPASLPPPNANSARPPHNIEVEQQLLGAILIDDAAFYSVADIVSPDDFFEPIHAEIYSVIGSLIKTARVATPVTLKSFLPANLDIVGMPLENPSRLCSSATTVVNAPDFARDIAELAKRRRMITIGSQLIETVQYAAPEATSAAIASEAIDSLDIVATETAKNYTQQVTVGAAANEALERMSAVRAAGGGLTGISSGLNQ